MFYVSGNYWRGFIHETSKKINNVNKQSNDIMSVIIILGTDVYGGEKVFKLIEYDFCLINCNCIDNVHLER